jgi:hypothetical protein
MDRRDFLSKSGYISAGLIVNPSMLVANPILGFFARLGAAVFTSLVTEGITTWIKNEFFEDDFKDSVIGHSQQLSSQGFMPYPSVYSSGSYFIYPAIKPASSFSNSRLKAPFYSADHNNSSIIDMDTDEFEHLTCIVDRIKVSQLLQMQDLKDSMMPVEIIARKTLNARNPYLHYNSINKTQVRYEGVGSSKGLFIIDGPFGKEASTYELQSWR